jgi:hypothetical protein
LVPVGAGRRVAQAAAVSLSIDGAAVAHAGRGGIARDPGGDDLNDPTPGGGSRHAPPLWRSLLYVPANNRRFIDKAHTRNADEESLLLPKQWTLYAARAAGVVPLGLVGSIADYADLKAMRCVALRSRRLGFEGASCTHIYIQSGPKKSRGSPSVAALRPI